MYYIENSEKKHIYRRNEGLLLAERPTAHCRQA